MLLCYIVRYIGRVVGSKSDHDMYGIEWDIDIDADIQIDKETHQLQIKTRGKNDGAVNGTRYFTCQPNCGSFIHKQRIIHDVTFLLLTCCLLLSIYIALP